MRRAAVIVAKVAKTLGESFNRVGIAPRVMKSEAKLSERLEMTTLVLPTLTRGAMPTVKRGGRSQWSSTGRSRPRVHIPTMKNVAAISR
ncbi:MAG: hypothetical protein JWP89_5801 [Schlesneria sp.]|nr:hypothetical protein [Schlesneria sp.]